MKILVVGSGGREHAIGLKLAESTHKPQLFFAPGNPGVASLGQRLEIDALDVQGLAIFARRERIDLTVVGPEAPLAAGIVDVFNEKGLTIFGPEKSGAFVEASKAFAKSLMAKANVPTGDYAFCESQTDALKTLERFEPPYVIKEDGLAAGKGVTIAQTKAEAEAAIDAAFAKSMPVVIEQFLQGEELSILTICDGKQAIPMVGAQDFKRVDDGNAGPNTGGMGAYAPVPFVMPDLLKTVQETVLAPMMQAFQSEGIDYRGVLYAGLMISPDGKPDVIEFNARFGDPETQVVLPLLEDDLVDVLMASATGDLSAFKQGFRFKSQSAVTVVLASGGYPGDFEKGKPITLPTSTEPNVSIIHAGTGVTPAQLLVTAGGRVLNVTATGSDLNEARKAVYSAIEQVHFDGMHYRSDIAEQAALSACSV
jgi:phosphoribosylamine--glycine ligase